MNQEITASPISSTMDADILSTDINNTERSSLLYRDNAEIKKEDINIEEHQHNDTDNDIHSLELPDHDFSKLLEFDSKHDDAILSAANDILNNSNDDDKDLLDNDKTDGMSDGIKLSNDIEEKRVITDEGNNEFKAGKDSTNEINIQTETQNDKDVEVKDISDKEPTVDSVQKLDRTSPQAIIYEKNNLFNRQRKNSLIPTIPKNHELPVASTFVTTQNIHDNISSYSSINGERSSNSKLQGKYIVTEGHGPFSEEQSTISAYARLDFQNFTFYVQTLHVIIGRRSENDFTHKVDVNLGPSKSISRRHAQIFYNFGTGRFELSVIGKNGAFIDDVFIERGNTVPLRNKTKVQIGQIPFQFVLPEKEKGAESKNFKSSQTETSGTEVKNENGKKPRKKQVTSKTKTTAISDVKDETVLKEDTKTISSPKKKKTKTISAAEKKTAKPPKKVYTLNEIPPEYRTKPISSYSTLLTTCLRKYSTPKGMSLSEIYAGIKELFPYYKYCPDGWQSSVRHNLSLNKSFKKISKEGKGWLWGLDEKHIAERELQKKKQAENAAAKAQANQLKEQQKGRKTMSGLKRGTTKDANGKEQNISQTLAANRSTTKKTKMDDHQRTMKYLQEQLMILTKDRKGLTKPVIASILTQALAMTINQVTQAAKNKGITGNPLTALMDKNPQHLNLILAAAVNAATSKVTNGKVKQLVSLPHANAIVPPAAKPKASTTTSHPVKKQTTPIAATSTNSTPETTQELTKPPSKSSKTENSNNAFDPTSLSRFFQPRQPARVPTPPEPKRSIPKKRSLSNSSNSSAEDDDSSSGSSSSEELTSSDEEEEKDEEEAKNETRSKIEEEDKDEDEDKVIREREVAQKSDQSGSETNSDESDSSDNSDESDDEKNVTEDITKSEVSPTNYADTKQGEHKLVQSSVSDGQSELVTQPLKDELHNVASLRDDEIAHEILSTKLEDIPNLEDVNVGTASVSIEEALSEALLDDKNLIEHTDHLDIDADNVPSLSDTNDMNIDDDKDIDDMEVDEEA